MGQQPQHRRNPVPYSAVAMTLYQYSIFGELTNDNGGTAPVCFQVDITSDNPERAEDIIMADPSKYLGGNDWGLSITDYAAGNNCVADGYNPVGVTHAGGFGTLQVYWGI